MPAHNEAAVISRTVGCLGKLDWPEDRYRIRVIADNCTDTTALIARSLGAEVLERKDETRRGKGYALAFAFADSVERQWADAVVVVDADTDVSPNLLEAFASRLERGSRAIQSHYGVRNPLEAWRTRLMAIAMAAFHMVRSRARARLGVSAGIRGNGWCLARETLQLVPYRAFTLAEDLEYGIDLGMAGVRVDYAEDAIVLGEMVSAEASARSQRLRWEGGRWHLVRNRTLPLLAAALRQRSALRLDLALDLLVVPLSYLILATAAFSGLAALRAYQYGVGVSWLALGLAVGCWASLLCYVLRGWQLSGVGAQGLLDFARVPAFLAWRVLLALRWRKPNEWVRTNRDGS